MSHHPPHLYLDDTWYVTTAATQQHAPYLSEERAKEMAKNKLREAALKYGLKLRAWVILDNHYHLLFKPKAARNLSRFFGHLHGATSWQLNEWAGQHGRNIWHNYWDTCIRDERGYWMRFNYIHNNPVKHRYVEHPADWPFSSYHYYYRKYGAVWLDECFARYPVLDYWEGDDF